MARSLLFPLSRLSSRKRIVGSAFLDCRVPRVDLSKAEYEQGAAPALTSCAVCSQTLVGPYFAVGPATVCATCAAKLKEPPSSQGAFLRVVKALFLGGGAGLLGAIGYSLIISVANMELALVTIFIGWFVGRGVMKGSEGRGGLGYQVLSAFLTYFWCMMAYVPTFVMESQKTADPPSMFVAVLISPFAALVVPFLGEMGILGTLILLFGVYQGFKGPTAPKIEVTGPFELATPGTAVAAEPASQPAAVAVAGAPASLG